MSYHEILFKLPEGNRRIKRHAIIKCFLDEEYKIFLKRPTQLNKGFDFTVNIEGLYFKKNRKYSNPSHQDIINALAECKNNSNDKYSTVKQAIEDLYNCKNTDLSKIEAYFYDFNGKKHPIQIILLAIKWLFMEQDCAYWNYSGRKMLFSALVESNLV